MISGTYTQWVKFEMKEKLEIDHLEKIKLNVDEVVWYEKDHEIIVNGSLFDVKAFAKQGDSIIFEGIFDQAETQLSILSENLINTSTNHQHLAQIGAYFHQLLFIQTVSSIDINFVVEPLKHQNHFISMYRFYYAPVATPPPESSFS
ncbi:MAG: hypothetical protein RLZZ333_1938, partial [Bacteroidota bacterium]